MGEIAVEKAVKVWRGEGVGARSEQADLSPAYLMVRRKKRTKFMVDTLLGKDGTYVDCLAEGDKAGQLEERMGGVLEV